MTFVRRTSSYILVLLITMAAGCRDTQPSPSYPADLGTEERPLPPPAASTWMNPALKDGRAEWQPFREPKAGQADASAPGGNKEKDGEEPAAEGSAAPDTPEAAIRTMISDYNALATEGKTTELLDFFVEAQIDAAKSLMEKKTATMTRLAELQQSIDAKVPDERERTAAAFNSLKAVADPRIEVTSVKVISPTEASGTSALFREGPTYRFVFLDGDWFVEIPAENLEGLTSALGSLDALIERWKDQLTAEQPDLATILADIEKAAAPASGSGGTSPDGDKPSDSTANPPDDAKTQPASQPPVGGG